MAESLQEAETRIGRLENGSEEHTRAIQSHMESGLWKASGSAKDKYMKERLGVSRSTHSGRYNRLQEAAPEPEAEETKTLEIEPALASEPFLTAREYHTLRAQDSYKEYSRHARATIWYALDVGEEMNQTRATFTEDEIRRGLWKTYREENFPWPQQTVNKWMRIAANREIVLDGVTPGSNPPGINEALETISAHYRDEDPSEPVDGEVVDPGTDSAPAPEPEPEDVEPEPEDEDPVLELPDGSRLTRDEAALRLERTEKRLEQAENTARQDKDRARELKEKSEQSESEYAAKMQELRREHAEELAEELARHGISSPPKASDLTQEEWLHASQTVRGKRADVSRAQISKLQNAVRQLSGYSVEEVSAAMIELGITESGIHELREVGTWLGSLAESLNQRTTPGKLRAIGVSDGGNDG